MDNGRAEGSAATSLTERDTQDMLHYLREREGGYEIGERIHGRGDTDTPEGWVRALAAEIGVGPTVEIADRVHRDVARAVLDMF